MKKLILSLLNIDVQKAKTARLGIISKIDKNHFSFGGDVGVQKQIERGKINSEKECLQTD